MYFRNGLLPGHPAADASTINPSYHVSLLREGCAMSSLPTTHTFHHLPPLSRHQHPATTFPGPERVSGAPVALRSLVNLSDSLPAIELPAIGHSQALDNTNPLVSQGNRSNRKKERPTPKGPRGRFGCRTCRQRHIKCDETRSVCDNCTKAKRRCLWNHEIRLSHDLRSSSSSVAHPRTASLASRASAEDSQPAGNVSEDRRWRLRFNIPLIPEDVLRDAPRDGSGNYLANLSHCEWIPDQILKFPLEACFFRFYIEHAGSWLDITSSSQHFALTVPHLAVSNPVLLFACLSYSARSLVPNSTLSEQYMSACINLLIPLLSDEAFVSTDETLLATLVILRHVEQYAEAPDDKGAHLSGAFSLIASQRFLPRHNSLPGAALWIYMRQDIRQALLNRAPPKLKPGHGVRVENFDDGVGESSWADRACYLAALACTFAWGSADEEIDPKYLNHLLQSWETNLPKEYMPYHVSGDSIQYLASWHGEQLCICLLFDSFIA